MLRKCISLPIGTEQRKKEEKEAKKTYKYEMDKRKHGKK